MPTTERLESRLLFNAGDVDPTFGDGVGPVFTDFGNPADSADFGKALVILDDGRFLVAGDVGGDGPVLGDCFGVARYLPDGTLDLTFGAGDGRVTVDFGIDEGLGGMAVAPDGRIVLAGMADVNAGYRDVALARLLPDGDLDMTFGGDGKVTTAFTNGADVARAVAVQPDGKIVVAGEVSRAGLDMLVARYNVDGSLDAGFADGGSLIADYQGRHDSLGRVMVQPDGKIFAVGYVGRATRYGQSYSLRLNPDGSRDGTYAFGGTVLDFGNGSAASAALRLPDGKYVIGGWANTRTASDTVDHLNFAIARVTADGNLDPTFGTGGKTVVPHTEGGGYYSLARQSDGKILLASSVNPDNDGLPLRDYAALARFLPNGKIDTTFGAVGVKLVPMPGGPNLMAFGAVGDMALTADERILLGGVGDPPSPPSDFWVRQLLNDVGPYEVPGTVFRDDDADGNHDPAEPGLAGWRVYQDLNNNAAFDPGVQTFENNVPALPYTLPWTDMAVSTIEVAGMGPDLQDLDVSFNLTRGVNRDLYARLVSPAGTQVWLFFGLPAGHGDRLTGTVLDDEATTSIYAGDGPYTGRFKPENPLSAFDHQDPRGLWQLEVFDDAVAPRGTTATIQSWSLSLTTGGEPNAIAAADGSYSFTRQPAGDHVIRAEPQPRFTPTAPDGRAYSFRLPEDGVGSRDFGFAPEPAAWVVGRHVFYNNSRFDGRDPAANRGDDAAVATDKRPRFPGETASFENVTGYSRGINGVMVDVSTRFDFYDDVRLSFRVGTGGGTWAEAPAPLSITPRTDHLPLDIQRYTVLWADGAIRNKWLQVTVDALFGGRVVSTDVFYYGNVAGETGDAPPTLRVTAADVSRTRSALFTRGAAVDNPFDHNRDGFVNALDLNVVRGNLFASIEQPVIPALRKRDLKFEI